MKAMILIALSAMAVHDCTPAPTPPPPAPAPAPVPSPPPAPTPTQTADAAPHGDVYDAACAHEQKLGCPVKSDCAAVFRHAVSSHITVVSEATAQCIVKAGDKAAVRACGYADCP